MAHAAQMALPFGHVPWLLRVVIRRPRKPRPKPVRRALLRHPGLFDSWPSFIGRHHSLPIKRPTPDWLREDLTDEDRLELRVLRPRTRGDCVDGPRPCPWVSCRSHLYLEVAQGTGSLMFHHQNKWPWELEETCALDVADRAHADGEHNDRRVVGDLLGLDKERVRQIEVELIANLRRDLDGDDDDD